MCVSVFIKKKNASRPSEHPQVTGGEKSKCLGGIIDCKDKPRNGI